MARVALFSGPGCLQRDSSVGGQQCRESRACARCHAKARLHCPKTRPRRALVLVAQDTITFNSPKIKAWTLKGRALEGLA
jgi:hypothetical protein